MLSAAMALTAHEFTEWQEPAGDHGLEQSECDGAELLPSAGDCSGISAMGISPDAMRVACPLVRPHA